WEAWLADHHADTTGVWLKLAKRDAGVPSITYAQALDVALCYGWIDGQKASFDEQYWLQKFTPRRSKSVWSQVNCAKATELIAAGRMREAGLRQVEVARADGRWDAAYAGQRTIEIPPDFQAELDAHPTAQAFFATLNSANRYAFLWRIHTAKKPETRAARIRQFIEMLERGEKLHP
ncbi:MAG: YdeI family protein, partial [Ktedonobacterales bacterium]